jgi:hypothetical protein
VVGAVVGAPSVAPIVVGTIVPAVATIVVDAVVPDVVAHLMLALLVVGRIIAAAARLRDGRHRDRTGESECSKGFCVAGTHMDSSNWA